MTEPISLLDLRRKSKLVELGSGHTVKIQGLTAGEICDHLEKYPILRTISIGGAMSPEQAITGSSGALAAWVTSACGCHGNAEAEAIAANEMTIEDASEIVEASMALTFSRGFGPFSGRLVVLLGYITVGRTTAPEPRSAPRSPPVDGPKMPTNSGNSPPDSSTPSSTSTSSEDSPTPPT